jgi:hypothetical protein
VKNRSGSFSGLGSAASLRLIVTSFSRGVAVDVVVQMEEEKMEVAADAVVLAAGKLVAGGKIAGEVLYRIWTKGFGVFVSFLNIRRVMFVRCSVWVKHRDDGVSSYE